MHEAIVCRAQHGIGQGVLALEGAQAAPLALKGNAATKRASARTNRNRRFWVPRTVSSLRYPRVVDRQRSLERRVRVLLVGFALGAVLAGVTAVPLPQEVALLARQMGATPGAPGLSGWIATVQAALADTDRRYPFLFYGTDWLAFGHLMIAAAFWGPIRDPVRNLFVVRWGMFCCLASVPVALVFGPLRGIPSFWLPIDCAFGLVGIVPLLVVQRDIRELARITRPL